MSRADLTDEQDAEEFRADETAGWRLLELATTPRPLMRQALERTLYRPTPVSSRAYLEQDMEDDR